MWATVTSVFARRFRHEAIFDISPSGEGAEDQIQQQKTSFSLKKWPSSMTMKRYLRQIYNDTSCDIERIDWQPLLIRTLLSLLFLGWLTFLILALVFQGLFSMNVRQTDNWARCNPDGSVQLWQPPFSAWQFRSFFQVTVGFGRFSFATAKLIDVAWDLVVGRCGQAVLALVSWQVFREFLTASMRAAPISFRTYWIVFIKDEPSFMSTLSLFREFAIRKRALASRSAMAFMLITAVFILAFPTWSSAMTAYDKNAASYVEINGSFISLDSVHFQALVIHDGSRIKLSDEYSIPSYLPITSQVLDYYTLDPISYLDPRSLENCIIQQTYGTVSASAYLRAKGWSGQWNTSDASCTLSETALDYAYDYGFAGEPNGNHHNVSVSNWTSMPLSSMLNITAPGWEVLRGQISGDYLSYTESMYMVAGQIMNASYLLDNAHCKSAETYQWGFSFIPLFVMTLILFFWTIGIFVLRLHARGNLRLQGQEDITKNFKCAIELAVSIQNELAITKLNPNVLTSKELDQQIERGLDGGSITYPSFEPQQRYSLWNELREWYSSQHLWATIRREPYWTAAIVCSLALALVFFFLVSIYGGIPFAVLTPTLILGRILGRQVRTRVAIVFCTFCFGCLLIFPMWIIVFEWLHGDSFVFAIPLYIKHELLKHTLIVP